MRGLCILLGALALLAGCSDRERAAAVAPPPSDPSAPLVYVTHPTDPPCSYTNALGECLGTDVELAREIAAKMGRPLTVRLVEFEEIIPLLKSGKADLGIATITITEARRRDVDFSIPYASSGNCFLYRADGPRPRMSQIASLRIGAEAGTTGDLYLCDHGCDPVRYVRINDAVQSLARGDVDAIFFDAIPLLSWAARSNGKFIASPLETRESYGVAIGKNRSDLLAAANEVISARKKRGVQ